MVVYKRVNWHNPHNPVLVMFLILYVGISDPLMAWNNLDMLSLVGLEMCSKSMSVTRCEDDYTVFFFHSSPTIFLYLMVYVDDFYSLVMIRLAFYGINNICLYTSTLKIWDR